MTTTEKDLVLTVERTLSAAPEAVFDAWLDPNMLTKFMCPGPNATTPEAATDPKVGGRFDLIMKNGDDALPHGGVYKVIDRPRQIVFTWESPFSVEGSEVTIEFTPTGRGTHVRLTHIRFATEELRDNHNAGWTAILEMLDSVL